MVKSAIVNTYVSLILAGRRTLKSVPEQIRKQVEALLAEQSAKSK